MSDAHKYTAGLPEVHDEAPNTPNWLPWLGLALLIAAVLLWGARSAPVEETKPVDSVPVVQ